MANQWNQTDFSTAGGVDITTTQAGDSFTLTGYTLLHRATVYLIDGVNNDNGLFDSFSGKLTWGIYRAGTNGAPTTLMWSSDARDMTVVDTGMQSASGADIFKVDFTLFEQVNVDLAAGDYFFMLREGNSLFNGTGDGSPIYWSYENGARGIDAQTPLVVNGITNWLGTGHDTSFQLWSPLVGAGFDTFNAPTNPIYEDTPVLLDVLANDWLEPGFSISSITAPGHGTAVLDDNGTPGDASDDRILYTPNANYFGTDSFKYTITNGGESSLALVTLTVQSVNDAATVSRFAGDVAAWNEGDGGVRLDRGLGAIVADVDSTNFAGGTLSVSIPSGGNPAEDQIYFATDDVVTISGSMLSVRGIAIGSLGGSGSNLTLAMTANATKELVAIALQHLSYANSGGALPTGGARTVSYSLTDGQGTANGGHDTVTWTSTVNVTALDHSGVANADSRATSEGAMVNIAVLANDSTANGPLSVARIDGTALTAGQSVTLTSGAVVTLQANGKLLYDPHGAFDWLASPTTAAATGATGSAVDKFSYTLADGSSALVSVTLSGFDNGDGRVYGTAGNDTLTGTANADTFMLQAGGADHVTGGNGNDTFYFGAYFAAGDTVDGGAGTDMLVLQGNYGSPGQKFVLGAHSLDNVEMLVLMSGSNTSYGTEAAHDNYYLKLTDAALAAGSLLTVQANKLDAFEALNFDGSAETDAQFRLIGGSGSDVLIGGAKDDWISGGQGSNSLKGGGGADTFYFVDQGAFSIGSSINDLTSIDKVDLSAFDANRSTTADDAFTFIGMAAFHHVAGELRVETDYSGGWTIQGDTNGDGAADVFIDVSSNFTTVDGFHFIL